MRLGTDPGLPLKTEPRSSSDRVGAIPFNCKRTRFLVAEGRATEPGRYRASVL